uniref:Uncharacterized protein n=1 Tax=Aegilops tauschii subsp. strangulata TaxID=200361 RepID=A0A453B904_AEGTS
QASSIRLGDGEAVAHSTHPAKAVCDPYTHGRRERLRLRSARPGPVRARLRPPVRLYPCILRWSQQRTHPSHTVVLASASILPLLPFHPATLAAS